MSRAWKESAVAADGTHHTVDGCALYGARYQEVLKFHEPGLAPARDATGAFHIKADGAPAYEHRFLRVFGFYEGIAAVAAEDGWYHIHPEGQDAYNARWDWCGNVQGGRCTVRAADGGYGHVDASGKPLSGLGWRYAGDYRDGIAVVQAADGRSTHIDVHGRFLHEEWFLDLDVFHKAFARARDGLGWMHVDARGRPAYSRRFAAVEPFYNGQARVERFDGGLEVIDEQGRTQVELRGSAHAPAPTGEVIARTAWGRVRRHPSRDGEGTVSKWSRGTNDREAEALLELRGLPGVPRILDRRRYDLNDTLSLSWHPGAVLGHPRRLRVYEEGEALSHTIGLLEVFAGVHGRGWVHTDLHPGNVLLGPPLTLIDFACAVRATETRPWRGEVNWGVWDYLPPEMLADYGEIGPAADVYAVAMLLVAMLRGAPPRGVDVAMARQQGGWPAVRAAFRSQALASDLTDLRDPLARALAPALNADPSRRPSASRLAQELSHV